MDTWPYLEPLEHFCLAKLGPQAAPRVIDWAALPGGWEHESWSVVLEVGAVPARRRGTFVLRLGLRQGAHQAVTREVRTLHALARLGYPAPRIFLSDPTGAALGTPFLLVHFIDGVLLMDKMPRVSDSERTQLRRRYCGQLAGLHALNWREVKGDLLGRLDCDTLLADAIAMADRAPTLAPLVAWLARRRRLVADRTAVVHGDPHLANAIAGTDGNITFIDWSAAGLGDPRVDIGRALMLIRAYGSDDRRDRFVAEFEATMGPLTHLDWFEVHAAVRHLGHLADGWGSDGKPVETHHLEAARRIAGFAALVTDTRGQD